MNAYAALLAVQARVALDGASGLLVLASCTSRPRYNSPPRIERRGPNGYDEGKPIASFASRTILMSGLIIFAFMIYHLMHFTFGVTNPEFMRLEDTARAARCLQMVVLGFRNPWVSAFYLISMGLLCLHLSHGLSSMFQSLGSQKNGPTFERSLCLHAYPRFSFLSATVRFPLRYGGVRQVISQRQAGCRDSEVRFQVTMKLDAKIPAGPLAEKWGRHRTRHQADQPGEQAQV